MYELNEPLTLFFFVTREAQRFDGSPSDYNRRQTVPLALEVDALVIVILRGAVPNEFQRFAELVGEMRKAQHELLKVRALVADANCIRLESAVDAAVARYIDQVKRLNALIAEGNCADTGYVMSRRRRK